MVLTDPTKYQGVLFEEKHFKKDRIKKFLREFAYGSKKNPKGDTIQELNDQALSAGIEISIVI